MKHLPKVLVVAALLLAPAACKTTPTTGTVTKGSSCSTVGSTAKTSAGQTVTCRKSGTRKTWQ